MGNCAPIRSFQADCDQALSHEITTGMAPWDSNSARFSSSRPSWVLQ
jgi:hypothetical protein